MLDKMETLTRAMVPCPNCLTVSVLTIHEGTRFAYFKCPGCIKYVVIFEGFVLNSTQEEVADISWEYGSSACGQLTEKVYNTRYARNPKVSEEFLNSLRGTLDKDDFDISDLGDF